MLGIRHALLLLPILSACTSPHPSEHELLLRMAAEHEADFQRFRAEQADFEGRTELPQTREYPGLGTLIVDDVSLVGRPGKAWVHAHFTFVNSGGAGFDAVRVGLYLRDPQTGESWSEALELCNPLGGRLSPESTYTAALKTPTRGVELLPGWSWELALEARESEPR